MGLERRIKRANARARRLYRSPFAEFTVDLMPESQQQSLLKLLEQKAPMPSLKEGEIIRARSLIGFFPDGIYKVSDVTKDHVTLTVGEIMVGADVRCVEILERGLTEPLDWEMEEQTFKLQNSHAEDCPHCRKERERAMAAVLRVQN